MTMGCYGIGVTRTMSAIIEQNHDEHGIIWPINVAPFTAGIVLVNAKDENMLDLADKLYNELNAAGIDTLLDDRNERVGVKFNDMDLIGVPIRITVGNKIKDQTVEIKLRDKEEIIETSLYDAISKIEDIMDI